MSNKFETYLTIIFLIAMITLSFFAGKWKGETTGLREQDSVVITQLRANVNNRGQFILWTAKRDTTGITMQRAKKLGFLR